MSYHQNGLFSLDGICCLFWLDRHFSLFCLSDIFSNAQQGHYNFIKTTNLTLKLPDSTYAEKGSTTASKTKLSGFIELFIWSNKSRGRSHRSSRFRQAITSNLWCWYQPSISRTLKERLNKPSLVGSKIVLTESLELVKSSASKERFQLHTPVQNWTPTVWLLCHPPHLDQLDFRIASNPEPVTV